MFHEAVFAFPAQTVRKFSCHKSFILFRIFKACIAFCNIYSLHMNISVILLYCGSVTGGLKRPVNSAILSQHPLPFLGCSTPVQGPDFGNISGKPILNFLQVAENESNIRCLLKAAIKALTPRGLLLSEKDSTSKRMDLFKKNIDI